jgi:hypothetical protein
MLTVSSQPARRQRQAVTGVTPRPLTHLLSAIIFRPEWKKRDWRAGLDFPEPMVHSENGSPDCSSLANFSTAPDSAKILGAVFFYNSCDYMRFYRFARGSQLHEIYTCAFHPLESAASLKKIVALFLPHVRPVRLIAPGVRYPKTDLPLD